MKYKKKAKLLAGVSLATAVVMAAPMAEGAICLAADKTADWETPSGITADQLEEKIDSMVDEYLGKTVQGLAVAVVKDGDFVFEKGYGDAGPNIPVDPKSTVFEYGSVTKLFSWVSAMQLAEQGRLDLNADVTKYLPKDFQVPVHTPITMMNLMNHTAGFDDYAIGLLGREDNYTDLRTALEEHKVKQINEPDTICSYSNYGAGLAGYIVENIAGQNEYEYVRQHIFDVLGMSNVTQSYVNDPVDQMEKNKSMGYERKSDGSLAIGTWSYIPMYAAGEGNGTIEELAKFGIGLMDENSGLFEKPETYREFLSTTYQANEDITGTAHGFFEYDGEYKTYWHDGETNDFTTFFAVVPQADFVVAVSANTKSPDCHALVHNIGWTMVAKKEVELMTPQENLPSTGEVAGNYSAPRRFHYGIPKMMYLIAPYDIKVKAINDKEITINKGTYRQVKPYVYQDEESGELSAFSTKDGKVVSYTYIQGYQKNGFGVILNYIITYLIAAVGVITFLGSIVYQLVHIVNRQRRVRKVMLVIQAAWLGYVFNLIDLAYKILSGARFNELELQLYLNLGQGIIIAGAAVFKLIQFYRNQEKTRSEKNWAYYYYTVQLLALIALFCWGGFQITA